MAGLARDGCFNIAVWSFAFEYYQSAVAMPFIFKQEEMPEQRRVSLELLNKIFYHLNIWMVLIYYIVLFYMNWESVTIDKNPAQTSVFWLFFYSFTHYSVGMLQLISGMFLLVAVF